MDSPTRRCREEEDAPDPAPAKARRIEQETREDVADEALWEFAKTLVPNPDTVQEQVDRVKRFCGKLSHALKANYGRKFSQDFRLAPELEAAGSIRNLTNLLDSDIDLLLTLNPQNDDVPNCINNSAGDAYAWSKSKKVVSKELMQRLGDAIEFEAKQMVERAQHGFAMDSFSLSPKLRFTFRSLEPPIVRFDLLPALLHAQQSYYLLDHGTGELRVTEPVDAAQQLEDAEKLYKGLRDVIRVLKLMVTASSHPLALPSSSCESLVLTLTKSVGPDGWSALSFCAIIQKTLSLLAEYLGNGKELYPLNNHSDDLLRKLREPNGLDRALVEKWLRAWQEPQFTRTSALHSSLSGLRLVVSSSSPPIPKQRRPTSGLGPQKKSIILRVTPQQHLKGFAAMLYLAAREDMKGLKQAFNFPDGISVEAVGVSSDLVSAMVKIDGVRSAVTQVEHQTYSIEVIQDFLSKHFPKLLLEELDVAIVSSSSAHSTLMAVNEVWSKDEVEYLDLLRRSLADGTSLASSLQVPRLGWLSLNVRDRKDEDGRDTREIDLPPPAPFPTNYLLITNAASPTAATTDTQSELPAGEMKGSPPMHVLCKNSDFLPWTAQQRTQEPFSIKVEAVKFGSFTEEYSFIYPSANVILKNSPISVFLWSAVATIEANGLGCLAPQFWVIISPAFKLAETLDRIFPSSDTRRGWISGPVNLSPPLPPNKGYQVCRVSWLHSREISRDDQAMVLNGFRDLIRNHPTQVFALIPNPLLLPKYVAGNPQYGIAREKVVLMWRRLKWKFWERIPVGDQRKSQFLHVCETLVSAVGGVIGNVHLMDDKVSVLTGLTEEQDRHLKYEIEKQDQIRENGQPVKIKYKALIHPPPCIELVSTQFGLWRCRKCGKFASF